MTYIVSGEGTRPPAHRVADRGEPQRERELLQPLPVRVTVRLRRLVHVGSVEHVRAWEHAEEHAENEIVEECVRLPGVGHWNGITGILSEKC